MVKPYFPLVGNAWLSDFLWSCFEINFKPRSHKIAINHDFLLVWKSRILSRTNFFSHDWPEIYYKITLEMTYFIELWNGTAIWSGKLMNLSFTRKPIRLLSKRFSNFFLVSWHLHFPSNCFLISLMHGLSYETR